MTYGAQRRLDSLLTIEDVATRFGINHRRARALAQQRHAQLGIGRKVCGWIFMPDELPYLAPGKPGRPPRNTRREPVSSPMIQPGTPKG